MATHRFTIGRVASEGQGTWSTHNQRVHKECRAGPPPGGHRALVSFALLASSNRIRWGGLAAVLGGALFMAVDGATTGTASAVQQTLLLLGTVLLMGGLVVFLAAFFGTGLFAGLDPDRRAATLASMALGAYCLLAVPVYYLVFTDEVTVLGGESPSCVLLGLVVVPLLLRNGGARALMAVTLVGVAFLLAQILAAFLALELPGGVGLTTVFSEAGGSVPLFERVEGCTLIMCGLDHVLFHFSQIPFLAVIAIFGHRAYRSASR
jgi:hypothetical protein